MDPWRSPKWVGDAHLADQSAYFQRNWWPATTRSRLPAPVQTETRAVPSDYGPGPNNRKRIKNAREEAIETNEHQSVDGPKVCFLGAVRRRTMICCSNVKISALSAARDRNRSPTAHTMSLTRSLITDQHRPILGQPPANRFATGTAGANLDRVRIVASATRSDSTVRKTFSKTDVGWLEVKAKEIRDVRLGDV